MRNRQKARRVNNLNRSVISVVVGALFVALSMPVEAQQATKVYRVGFLSSGPGIRQQDEVLQKGLRERGYIEGQNMISEWRFTKGQAELLPELAAELVRLKVDCLVTSGILATRAGKQATTTIPIVMIGAGDDPIRQELIASLARPGGNITGVIDIASELAGKRLALLKETLPRISKIGHLSDRNSPSAAAHLKEVEAAARTMGLRFFSLEVQSPGDFDNAFRVARKERVDALIVAAFGLMNSYREEIVKLVNKARLPAMYTTESFVLAGGLMSYADNLFDRALRAAVYVDKILKGAKPADLPVEAPRDFKLIINLKAAKQIGVTIPQSVLYRADKVIK
jgi:putative ABC transport system substrate-binding protein